MIETTLLIEVAFYMYIKEAAKGKSRYDVICWGP